MTIYEFKIQRSRDIRDLMVNHFFQRFRPLQSQLDEIHAENSGLTLHRQRLLILINHQLVGNKKITSAIQKARRSGSINAAIPILEQAIKSAPEAANIAKAKKLLASLKKKSKSDITMALITAANEKELSTAIEIMEKAVAENSYAENLEQAKNKLAELKKRSVAIAANGEAPNGKNSSKRKKAELAEKGRLRILREQRACMQRRQCAISSDALEHKKIDRLSNAKDHLNSLNRSFSAGNTAQTSKAECGIQSEDGSNSRPVYLRRIAEDLLN